MNKGAWILRMAWRDNRSSRRQLLLFSSSIVLGIAATAHRQADVDGLPLGNSGAVLWRSGPVTMLLVRPGTNGAAVLQSLRAEGVDQLSAVVLERPTNALWTSLAPVVSRYPPRVLVICGAPSALGATAVTGLQPGDVLQVQTHNRPWAVVRCNRGRAEVVAAATGP